MRLLHLHDLDFFPVSGMKGYLLRSGIREFEECGKVGNSRCGGYSRVDRGGTKAVLSNVWLLLS